jgi:hypothetical protein
MIEINHLKVVSGRLGRTPVFSVPNVRIESNFLKWDAFRMYTPIGNQIDSELNSERFPDGVNYFDVPGGSHEIVLDPDLYINFVLRATADKGLELFEVLEGDEVQLRTGNEGHHFITGCLPSVASGIDCSLDVWEIVDEEVN